MKSYHRISLVVMCCCWTPFLPQVISIKTNLEMHVYKWIKWYRWLISFEEKTKWTGNSAIKAITVLLSKGVPESNIIFLNLISVSLIMWYWIFHCLGNNIEHDETVQSPEGIHAVCKKFPKLKIVTSEIDTCLNKEMHVIPGMGEFGDRYFGTASKRPSWPIYIIERD